MRVGACDPDVVTDSRLQVPVCDTNFDPPRCSQLYHDQTQTPGYPDGDGVCAAPGCDVGDVPIGEYLFDPRAANVSVNGQTFIQWWIDEYVTSLAAIFFSFGPVSPQFPIFLAPWCIVCSGRWCPPHRAGRCPFWVPCEIDFFVIYLFLFLGTSLAPRGQATRTSPASTLTTTGTCARSRSGSARPR